MDCRETNRMSRLDEKREPLLFNGSTGWSIQFASWNYVRNDMRPKKVWCRIDDGHTSNLHQRSV